MEKKVALKNKYQGYYSSMTVNDNEVNNKIKEGYTKYDFDYGSNLVRKNTKLGKMLIRCKWEHPDSEVIYVYTPEEYYDSHGRIQHYYFAVMYKKL